MSLKSLKFGLHRLALIGGHFFAKFSDVEVRVWNATVLRGVDLWRQWRLSRTVDRLGHFPSGVRCPYAFQLVNIEGGRICKISGTLGMGALVE